MSTGSRSSPTSLFRAGEHLVSLAQAGEGDTVLAAVARGREASKSAQETLLVGRYCVMCYGTCTVMWYMYCAVVLCWTVLQVLLLFFATWLEVAPGTKTVCTGGISGWRSLLNVELLTSAGTIKFIEIYIV